MNRQAHRLQLHRLLVLLLLAIVAACGQPMADETALSPLPSELGAANAQTTPVSLSRISLTPPTACTGRFIPHTLDHTTQTRSQPVRMFETNGAGVAINDLNGDGQLDIVLANLNGPASILWNDGALQFHRETLPDQRTRSVNIVDVDGDGRLDIVFTHVSSSLSAWHNQGTDPPSFKLTGLPNVHKPAHAQAWGDLNGDNRLDLVAGSYDAELTLEMTNSFLFGGGAGLFYYENSARGFIPQRLAGASQALAIALFDFDGDGRRDILVGNDFDIPDMAWRREPAGWQPATPFAHTSHSTMSLDWGAISNDGQQALFGTDMNPYDTSPETWARWLPMMESMSDALPSDDPQQTQNVLQINDGRDFHELAAQRGVIASGWSWSGKFGDLDNDGFLDLYVVNGMIDQELFAYLPDYELIESNQLFRNLGDGTFAPQNDWGTALTASGRGLSLADLDLDGDLDMVINNLLSPALLLENQLCEGAGLEVELYWPETGNSHALGSTLYLQTSVGLLQRDVRAGSGYLSGDPARVHFGLPAGAIVGDLLLVWPDGATSQLTDIRAGQLLQIERRPQPPAQGSTP